MMRINTELLITLIYSGIGNWEFGESMDWMVSLIFPGIRLHLLISPSVNRNPQNALKMLWIGSGCVAAVLARTVGLVVD